MSIAERTGGRHTEARRLPVTPLHRHAERARFCHDELAEVEGRALSLHPGICWVAGGVTAKSVALAVICTEAVPDPPFGSDTTYVTV